jgi:RND superfamily putative drug exporter
MRLLGDLNWWAPRPLRWAYDRFGIGDIGVAPQPKPAPAAALDSVPETRVPEAQPVLVEAQVGDEVA